MVGLEGRWVRVGVTGIALAIVATLTLSGCSSSKSAKLDPFAGQGSPRYPGNGPLPRGGGRYYVGEPYQVAGRWFTPREEPDYDKVGVASWYGPQFHRRQTSNGEWFDMNYLTAAHATLPLPCFAKVTNLENGREVIVRINDRGPFVGDRIIDLSREAASVLGYREKGKARVRVQYIGPAPLDDKGSQLMAMNRQLKNDPQATEIAVASPQPEPVTVASLAEPIPFQMVQTSGYFVQVGSFSDPDNAERTRIELMRTGPVQVTAVNGSLGKLYRVRIGPLANPTQAQQALEEAVNAGHPDARLVVAEN